MFENPGKLIFRSMRASPRHSEEPDQSCVASAAILHMDVVESTRLVQQDLLLAHLQIQHLYLRLCRICKLHNAIPRELRGDAAVVEFPSPIDAVLAALAIHSANSILNNTRIGRVNPSIRTGISYGPVISNRQMITGQAVIRAQRVEQLAKPGQVLFDQSVYDQLAPQQNLEIRKLGSERLKGFGQPTTIYQASVRQDGRYRQCLHTFRPWPVRTSP